MLYFFFLYFLSEWLWNSVVLKLQQGNVSVFLIRRKVKYSVWSVECTWSNSSPGILWVVSRSGSRGSSQCSAVSVARVALLCLCIVYLLKITVRTAKTKHCQRWIPSVGERGAQVVLELTQHSATPELLQTGVLGVGAGCNSPRFVPKLCFSARLPPLNVCVYVYANMFEQLFH